MALKGWKKYQNIYFIHVVADLCSTLNKWGLLNNTLQGLPLETKKELMKSPYIVSVEARMFMELNQPNRALLLYQKQYHKQKNDYRFLLQVSDALEKANKLQMALKVRKLAWYQNNLSLAEYVLNYRFNKQKVPAWVEQYIALNYNDREKLQYLLNNKLSKLHYRDRVIVAQKIGQERLAQELAYQGMKEHPNDDEMYNLMVETMLVSANTIDIEEAYKKVGYIVGPKSQIEAKIFLTPRVSFSPYVNYWSTRSTDKEQLLLPRSFDSETGFDLNMKYNHGNMNFCLSERRSLKNFVTASLDGDYRFNSKLNTRVFVLGSIPKLL